MTDELFPDESLEFALNPIINAALSRGQAASVPVEQRFLYAAQGRLLIAQARREEVHASREERLALSEAPRSLFEVIGGRFDLVVVGFRGSGKSRAVAGIRRRYEEAGGQVFASCGTWPDWKGLHSKRIKGLPALLQVDEAGALIECGDGEVPPELTRALNFARHLDLSLMLTAQHTSQLSPSIFRQGIGMLVTGAPWAWRVLARKELVDKLDAAQAVLVAGRRHDRRAVGYVDAEGFAEAVVID